MAERHRGRAVAGVSRVPEIIVSIVAEQDVASLADLAVPGVASGAGEDGVLGDGFPADEGPGEARPAGLSGVLAAATGGGLGAASGSQKGQTRQEKRAAVES